MKYIITHSGDCHWDDLLSVGFAQIKYGPIPVFRREPTAAELDDPEILILDIGRRLEPDKHNYDHHQLPPEQLECALTLFLRHEMPEEYEVLKKGSSLLDVVSKMDTLGPLRYANGQRLDLTVLEPLDAPIRQWFGASTEVAQELLCFMQHLAAEHLAAARSTLEALGIVEAAERLEIDNIKVIRSYSDHQKFKHVLDSIKRESYDVLILPDNRGPGWMLFRNNDHPRVDFTRVANDPRVGFAHKNGFIAKTKERLGDEEILELLRRAIK